MARRAGPSQRQLKAGEVIRRTLAEILAREPLRDPDLVGVSITISEVRASPDLKHALVFAAPLGGGDPSNMIAALNRSSAYLRGLLGKDMVMKSTPALKFLADSSFDEASAMYDLLSRPEIKRDLQD